MRQVSEVTVEGKHLRVSNLDKVLYPRAAFTKGQVIDYYVRISPVILPHLKDRPLTLKRYPEGVEREFFYEKQCPGHRPGWVKTARVEGSEKIVNYCLANNLSTLVWAANLADLEMHTSLSRAPDIDVPSMVVFDLDPGLPANIIQCCEVAFWLKEKLENINIQSFPKTSGSKGLQIYIPLNTKTDYRVTKAFAKNMAEALEREHPNEVVSKMAKILRKGRVLVDWSQNDVHKTTVCVYSLRAKDQPTVSTPVTWEEVALALKKKDPKRLTFVAEDTLARVEKQGDIFEPVLTLKQKLKSVEL